MAGVGRTQVQLILDFRGEGRRLYREPVRVLTAHDVSEVIPALRAVEAGLAEGLHAAGYIAYEAAPAFDNALQVRSGNRTPLLCFGLFRSVDRGNEAAPTRDRAQHDDVLGPWAMSTPRAEFDDAIRAIRAAIAEGRTYQVNYSTRFHSLQRASDDNTAYTLYERLRAAQGPGYHALLDLGQFRIISASPELFFQRRGGRITTRPMKGTRARGRWSDEDRDRARDLLQSEKDRAENLMIVDLLRNDLGRIARTGSVKVSDLFTVERYRTVLQLTSTITAEIADDTSLCDMLRALFPCGSVTGAPKVSTMEVIAALESSPREVYCGTIGCIEPNGDCTFSVPIRTMWLDGVTGECEYGSGAGITWDSSTSLEYEEVVAKAAVLNETWTSFELFETMRVENGLLCRRDRHIARLSASAEYFDYPVDHTRLTSALDHAVRELKSGVYRLRLLLDADGNVRTTGEPFEKQRRAGADGTHPEAPSAPMTVAIARTPVDSNNRFLYHKTTDRRVYEQAIREHDGVFDVLLRNERGEFTEFTRGNLVVEIDGRRYTPPIDSGLLPGTLRGELLESGAISERVLTRDDLRAARRVWLINSLRGWTPVSFADVHTVEDPIPA